MTNEKIKCDICGRKSVSGTLTRFTVSTYGLDEWGSPRPEVSYTLCPECLRRMNLNLFAATVNTFEEARTEGYWNREDDDENK
jgi:hypothetical protein